MRISECLKTNLTLKDYATLIDKWEHDRMADGAENVFDLLDYKDFHLFATCYNVGMAEKCQKEFRFWFGGMNYNTPIRFPSTEAEARTLAINLIEDERILDNLEYYAEFYDFIMFLPFVYKPNNDSEHSLGYYRVLQHVTILIYNNHYMKNVRDGKCYEDVLDCVANLAYDFTDVYRETLFKTSLNDFILHFIVVNFERYFGEVVEEKYFQEAKEYFKTYSDWWEYSKIII